MTPAGAALAAGLILARVDAGILDKGEAAPVSDAVDLVLGPVRREALRAVWRAAHRCADRDHATMRDLARRWIDILGRRCCVMPTRDMADPG